MSERVENMGRQVEYRREQKRLVAKCEALRDALRRLLPIAEDVSTIDRERMLDTAVALDQGLLELNEVERRLAVVNEELGDKR